MGHWHADNELSTLQLKWKIEKVNEKGYERERRREDECFGPEVCIYSARAAGSAQRSSEVFKECLRETQRVGPPVGSGLEMTTLMKSLYTLVKRAPHCDKWSEQAKERNDPQCLKMNSELIAQIRIRN